MDVETINMILLGIVLPVWTSISFYRFCMNILSSKFFKLQIKLNNYGILVS
jgi:hypothetical protein